MQTATTPRRTTPEARMIARAMQESSFAMTLEDMCVATNLRPDVVEKNAADARAIVARTH